MKKFLSLLAALFIIECFQAHAEKRSVVLERYLTGHVDRSKTVRRSPMQIPLDVIYDDESRQIEICGVEEMDIQVYLYDEKENPIAYSSTINSTLDIPDGYSGIISIKIEGESWIATGIITVY